MNAKTAKKTKSQPKSKSKSQSASETMTEIVLPKPDLMQPVHFASSGGEVETWLEMTEAGVPANQLSVPISDAQRPRDDRLFRDPKNRRTAYWLPRYELAEEVVSGGQRQYRIRLSEDGDAWQLELTLQRFAAPQVEAHANAGNILPHQLSVLLVFGIGGGTKRSLQFDEIGEPGETVLARLTLSSLAERDQVLGALREPARGAVLTVRRTVRVAIKEQRRENQVLRPMPGVVAPIDRIRIPPGRVVLDRLRPGALPKPQLRYVGKKAETIRGNKFTRFRLAVQNWSQFQAALFKAAPRLPPCGNNRNASRTWVEVLDARTNRRLAHYCAFKQPKNLASVSFMVRAGVRPPSAVRVRLHDRQANKKVISDSLPLRKTPTQTTYRVINSVVDYTLAQQPFSFSPDLHPYIYDLDGIGDPDPGPPGALVRQRHTFGERTHSYFQDSRHRNLIYNLPDELRLKRFTGAYRPPQMTLTISQPGATTDSAQAALDYVITPHTDADRLEDARATMASRLNLEPSEIEFQPLLPKSVTYTVRRPSGAGLLNEERVTTPRIVEEPFSDRLIMPLEEFQLAFEMMRGETAGNVGGTVLAVIEGWDAETIPVEFNFGELTDEAYDLRMFVGGSDLLIKLANPIESPLVLENAKLLLSSGATNAEIELADTETKVTIAPGDEREFTASLPAGMDTSAMTVRPASGIAIDTDAEALLNAILDTTTLEYFRTVTIEAIPSTFRVPEDDPGKQIIAVVVAIESGSTLVLRETELSGTVRIDYPFADIMLGRPVPNTFRYTRRLVRANGEQDELEAREAQDDHIFITGHI